MVGVGEAVIIKKVRKRTFFSLLWLFSEQNLLLRTNRVKSWNEFDTFVQIDCEINYVGRFFLGTGWMCAVEREQMQLRLWIEGSFMDRIAKLMRYG